MRTLILLTILFALLPAPQVRAAKARLSRGSVQPAVRGISFSTARLSRATRSVVVTFLNLDKTQRVSYELRYTANGVPQGVVGTITPSGQTSVTRDLYFGTCSRGVCTAHANITGASLTVRTTTTGGGVNSKRYRVRI
jgi:hypothetical protein